MLNSRLQRILLGQEREDVNDNGGGEAETEGEAVESDLDLDQGMHISDEESEGLDSE